MYAILESHKWSEGHGRQTELRLDATGLRARASGALVGVTGRKNSGSALRMNWNGVKVDGDPLTDGDDLSERGLLPLGVEMANEGTKGCVGSGVRGGAGNVSDSEASSRVAELIHLA